MAIYSRIVKLVQIVQFFNFIFNFFKNKLDFVFILVDPFFKKTKNSTSTLRKSDFYMAGHVNDKLYCIFLRIE